MNNDALAGCGVVVTRPAHQAAELCAAIEAAGGTAFRFPTVEIRPRPFVAPAGTLDWWVFVSPNAVAHAGALLAAPGRTAALGPATAAALRAAGRTVEVEAPDGQGSEGLLADARFAVTAGARIAIVRGVGGRELIADTLVPRGVEVLRVEVYERGVPDATTDAAVAAAERALIEAWAAGRVHAVIATSNALLENLHRMLDARGRALLAEAQVVATSGRVLQLARQLGIRPDPLIAGSAASDALVATLAGWWRSRH